MRDPHARASAVAQSMPFPDDIVSRRCLTWRVSREWISYVFKICHIVVCIHIADTRHSTLTNPPGTHTLFFPISRSVSTSTPVSGWQMVFSRDNAGQTMSDQLSFNINFEAAVDAGGNTGIYVLEDVKCSSRWCLYPSLNDCASAWVRTSLSFMHRDSKKGVHADRRELSYN